jgi:hypothetical protein
MSIIHLYVKQHGVTKLKYFGKTTRKDPMKYCGSGSYWSRHIKKHGKQYVETINVWQFDCLEEATKFALKFSEENNIVESTEWANLTPENAKDGQVKGYKHSAETKKKMSEDSTGNRSRVGSKHNEKILSQKKLGKKHTQEHILNAKEGQRKSWTTERKNKHGVKHKILMSGTGNPQYGKCWMTNGSDNKIVSPESISHLIDMGYYKGRTI